MASQSNTTINEFSTPVEKIQSTSDISSLPVDLAGSLLIPYTKLVAEKIDLHKI